ncbi:WD40 repeat domain-containing protein, partial [Endozoicomonas sp. ISHI1]|uniref:WD40 repeat domain-containing protein n=1 Tax=Endozoicomonas sp. ISHI1 TaxID=2825882 RepID=UPI00214732B9
ASFDGKAKIYGLKSDGSWIEEAIISHKDWLRSATFSTDGCLVVTTGTDGTAKIYGQTKNGSWVEKAVVPHEGAAESTALSANGHHLVSPFHHNELRIYKLSMNH